tara:strand:- start:248 stop:559 length:312 start_codon:yes stop_codon:yes gene_type:complete
MKNFVLLILLVFTLGCQREKMNEVGVGYNKTLIVPPSNDLPKPGGTNQEDTQILSSNDNPLVNSILDKTDASKIDDSVVNKIDNESGYKTDKNFFQWLFNSNK